MIRLNTELYKLEEGNKDVNRDAFFNLVGTLTNNNICEIFTLEDRFLSTVIDIQKIDEIRSDLIFFKKKSQKKKKACPITGRRKALIRFYGNISRFELKNMVMGAEFLPGVVRSGW